MDNEPKPVEISSDGKKLYIIEDIKIWAESYIQALELLTMIKQLQMLNIFKKEKPQRGEPVAYPRPGDIKIQSTIIPEEYLPKDKWMFNVLGKIRKN